MTEFLSSLNAIGAVQTIVTVLVLHKIGKRYRWPLVGGLAALELPLRLMDDGDNATGRETFLGLVSVGYVSLVGLTKLFVQVLHTVARAVAPAKKAEPLPSLRDDYWRYAEEDLLRQEIADYIHEVQPTFEQLVLEYGDARDELFDVLLATERASEGGNISSYQ